MHVGRSAGRRGLRGDQARAVGERHGLAAARRAQLGEELFISGKTASVHVSNILAKLGASSRGEAVALAYRAGLITPEPTTSG